MQTLKTASGCSVKGTILLFSTIQRYLERTFYYCDLAVRSQRSEYFPYSDCLLTISRIIHEGIVWINTCEESSKIQFVRMWILFSLCMCVSLWLEGVGYASVTRLLGNHSYFIKWRIHWWWHFLYLIRFSHNWSITATWLTVIAQCIAI